MAHNFEIYRDKAGEFRVRFKYNSDIMWSSEGYSSKASAESLIASIKKNGPAAPVEHLDATERNILDEIRSAQVPASDRIVNPDHNSKEFKDFRLAHKKLAEKLRQANDLRDFETEELEVARHEVGEIREEAEKTSVRSERLWNMAKSTIFWIIEKAVDGIIKALAVGALIALAALLGIPLPIS